MNNSKESPASGGATKEPTKAGTSNDDLNNSNNNSNTNSDLLSHRRHISPSRKTAQSKRNLVQNVLDADRTPVVPSDEPQVDIVKKQRMGQAKEKSQDGDGGVVVAEKHLRRPLGLKKGAAPSSRDLSPNKHKKRSKSPTTRPIPGVPQDSRRHMQKTSLGHALNVSTVAPQAPPATLIVGSSSHHHVAAAMNRANHLVEEVDLDDSDFFRASNHSSNNNKKMTNTMEEVNVDDMSEPFAPSQPASSKPGAHASSTRPAGKSKHASDHNPTPGAVHSKKPLPHSKQANKRLATASHIADMDTNTNHAAMTASSNRGASSSRRSKSPKARRGNMSSTMGASSSSSRRSKSPKEIGLPSSRRSRSPKERPTTSSNAGASSSRRSKSPKARRGNISPIEPSTTIPRMEEDASHPAVAAADTSARSNTTARRTVEQLEQDKLDKQNNDPKSESIVPPPPTTTLSRQPPATALFGANQAHPGAWRQGGGRSPTEAAVMTMDEESQPIVGSSKSLVVDGDDAAASLPRPSQTLIEAELVQERSEPMIVAAVQVDSQHMRIMENHPYRNNHDENGKQPIYRHKQFYLVLAGIFCLLLVVIVVVAVAVTLSVAGGDDDSSGDSSSDVASPATTVAPANNAAHGAMTDSPYFDDYVAILSNGVVHNPGRLQEEGAPAFQALTWMLVGDAEPLDPAQVDSNRIVQRYVMVLFYLITSSGQEWRACNPPATPEDPAECEHLTCGSGGGGSGGNDNGNRRRLQCTVETANRWLSSTPECTWAGVSCDPNGWVEAIELDDYQMKGKLLHELGQLSSLEKLDLDGNSLTGKIPSTLALLPILAELKLKDNIFQGSLPVFLCNMTALEKLSLSGNQYTGSIPSCLGSLPLLEELEIGDNKRLSGPIPSELGDLSLLTKFEINNSLLTGTVPYQFCERPMDKLKVDCDEVECACCTDC